MKESIEVEEEVVEEVTEEEVENLKIDQEQEDTMIENMWKKERRMKKVISTIRKEETEIMKEEEEEIDKLGSVNFNTYEHFDWILVSSID